MDKIDEIIEDVCKEANCEIDDLSCNDWLIYLEKNLEFPFDAEMNFYSYSEYLKNGDIVSVKNLDDCYDMYGIIATVKQSRRKFHVTVDEMTAVDKKSRNYALIEAYQTWFDNL